MPFTISSNSPVRLFGIPMGQLVLVMLAGLSLASCATRRQNFEVKQGVQDVKTRLLALEHRLQSSAEGSVPVDKRIASMSADFTNLEQELRFLKGKLDTLEVGIGLGYVPGSSPGENSIANRMEQVEKRVTEIEVTQREILELLSKKKSKKSSRLAKTLGNLTEMERYFSKKKYSAVASAGEKIAEKANEANRPRILFLAAESFFQLKNFSKSAFYFHSFIDLKPQKNVAHTQLRLGQSYASLGDKETAAIYFEEVQAEFSSSPEAKQAQGELSKLRVLAKK